LVTGFEVFFKNLMGDSTMSNQHISLHDVTSVQVDKAQTELVGPNVYDVQHLVFTFKNGDTTKITLFGEMFKIKASDKTGDKSYSDLNEKGITWENTQTV
jgi:hypothetical protein